MTRVKILLCSTAAVVAVAPCAWAGPAAAASASVTPPASAVAQGAPTGVLGVCTPSWGSLVLPVCV